MMMCNYQAGVKVEAEKTREKPLVAEKCLVKF